MGFFTAEQWTALGQILGLSDREREVTRLMIEGLSRTEIAARLRKPDGKRLSAETVRVYIDRIFQKARVEDRLHLGLRLVRICAAMDDTHCDIALKP
jgi:DNA-binding CsgD family transcriptional regulator